MNETWQEITQPISGPIAALSDRILAQAQPGNPLTDAERGINNFIQGSNIENLLWAVGILLIGLIVSALVSSVVGGLLKKTTLDNRLAAWITGRPEGAGSPQVEKWISAAVFWIIFVFFLIAFFNRLNLTAVSQPLNTFLNQITGFLPKLAGALIWLGIAWVLATVAKMAVSRAMRAFSVDERLNQEVGAAPAERPLLLSDTVANALYWFIFLLFLPLILDSLEMQQALLPVNNLLNQILAAIPKILEAVLIGFVGWLLAVVVRRIVTNLLAAAGADGLGARFGISRTSGGQSLSWIVGTIVYVLILIPTAIAALNALDIQAISQPAVAMLNDILGAVPKIFTAALILAVAYILGRWIGDLVTNILTGIGFNNVFSWLGVQPPKQPLRLPQSSIDPEATILQEPELPTRTPSEFVGIVVQVGIMLFAVVAATDVLQIPALTAIVSGIVLVAGRVLAGLVVFAIGLYLANLAFSLIASSGTRQARLLGQTARIAIIAFVSALALQQMGIGSDIVNLAFGLLLGAIAVGIALAFGLGGREIAADQIREWLASFKQDKTPRL
ncbi:Conserved TM helix repeat-containing protein [Oscillatoria nigro-viridis PCC 7112]|uniref:Conserved TM helix repeat-containing protein n=1 Tax=Phormidium nigroviride PCC 7112 TaxID=179408 RepID=K9VD54_9CYAN|nr:mechanosensitive ion channel [Oscillatoria nigro-viridis]AFZ05866.1 Conserved TM helix repeat-containing protein [Oscillatoria nigro-viridis PCC 7112]